jgi:hypothetical protein
MIKKSLRSIRKLIPWYINGSLSPDEAEEVAYVIKQDDRARIEYEAWKHIHAAVASQEQRVPSAVDRQQIMSSLHQPNLYKGILGQSSRNLLAGALLTLSILILLWLVVRPGVVLQWSIEKDGMTSYRIYRASQGSSQYEMLKEIPTQANQWRYNFVDTLLVPGRNYIYRVEGIGADGVSAHSRTVNGRSLDILPSLLVLILASMIVGYGIVIVVQKPWLPKQITMINIT